MSRKATRSRACTHTFASVHARFVLTPTEAVSILKTALKSHGSSGTLLMCGGGGGGSGGGGAGGAGGGDGGGGE